MKRPLCPLFGFWQLHQWAWGEAVGQASSGDSSGLGELVTQQIGKVSIALVSLLVLWVFRSLIAQSQSALGTVRALDLELSTTLGSLGQQNGGPGPLPDFVCITGSC